MNSELVNPSEQEINELYLAEIRHELRTNLSQHIVEWAQQFGDKFQISAYSAVNGKWDDVKKDVQRERISQGDLTRLLDKMLTTKLISANQHSFYSRWWTTGQAGETR